MTRLMAVCCCGCSIPVATGPFPDLAVTVQLEGTDCTHLSPGFALNKPDCYWTNNGAARHHDSWGLKFGNTYKVKWWPRSDERVKIAIVEDDEWQEFPHIPGRLFVPRTRGEPTQHCPSSSTSQTSSHSQMIADSFPRLAGRPLLVIGMADE